MSRKIIAILLIVLLLAGGIGVFASEAGGPNDPLVSRSRAQKWADGLVKSAGDAIAGKLDPIYQRALDYAKENAPETSSAERRNVHPGGTVTLSPGASVTLLSGAATVKIDSGALVNATVGAEAVSGKLNKNHLYIACENTAATVAVSSESVFLLDGGYKVSAGKITFSDVPANAWYYANVYSAVESGLIEGYGDGSFRPNAELNLAATVKLAACMHQLHNEGEVTLKEGVPWYKVYVDYAVENGIVEAEYSDYTNERMNTAVSRREYVLIFHKALPESQYAQRNDIADDAVPDVKTADAGAAEIYAFYRAGIVEGSSSTPGVPDHSFLPDNNIKRSEVTAVISRMLDPGARSSFTIS